MDEETRRRVCSLVAGVLCADERMRAEENAFLKRVLTKLGLDPDTGLMPTPAAEIATELQALPEATRWETLHLVIQAAAADGEVDPTERAMVETIGRFLEVEPADVGAQLEAALHQRGE